RGRLLTREVLSGFTSSGTRTGRAAKELPDEKSGPRRQQVLRRQGRDYLEDLGRGVEPKQTSQREDVVRGALHAGGQSLHPEHEACGRRRHLQTRETEDGNSVRVSTRNVALHGVVQPIVG